MRWATFCLCFATPIAVAHADDAAFGGRVSALVPLEETRVRMAWEDVTIDALDSHVVKVVARYAFENPTAEPVHLRLGFPESCPFGADEAEGDCATTEVFRNLVTTVRGVTVSTRIGAVRAALRRSLRRSLESLGRIHLFDVDFGPGETVEITHAYDGRVAVGEDSTNSTYVSFVTRTGALWAGSIGRARFTVKRRWRPFWFGYLPASLSVKQVSEEPVPDDPSVTVLRFEIENWEPRTDFWVEVQNEGVSTPSVLGLCDLTPCPEVDDLAAAQLPFVVCPEPWILQPGTWEWLNRLASDLDIGAMAAVASQMPPGLLRRCRNLPFALHGRPFSDGDLARFFYAPLPPGFFGLAVSATYADSLMRPLDWKYVELIDRAMGLQSERAGVANEAPGATPGSSAAAPAIPSESEHPGNPPAEPAALRPAEPAHATPAQERARPAGANADTSCGCAIPGRVGPGTRGLLAFSVAYALILLARTRPTRTTNAATSRVRRAEGRQSDWGFR